VTAPNAPVQFPQANLFQNVFFDQNAEAQLNLPEIYHFSVYQRFARCFGLMGDIAWTRWSRLQSVPITFQSANTPANILTLEYRDALRYAIGMEWYANRCLTFRLGFAYDETPIHSADTRTPRIPDSNRYLVTTGLRWSPTRSIDIDLGYGHVFVIDPIVNVTDSQGHNLRGRFEAAVDIVSASITYRWGESRR
jgi:long-chain fatty acid transport protein